MPLGRKSIRKPKSQKKEMDSRKAALRLIKFEKSLGSDKEEEKEKSAREKLICDQEINTKLKSEKKEIDSKKAALPLNQFEKSLRSNKKRKREELICDQESEKLICDQEINKKLKSEKKMMNSKKTALPLIQFEKILLSDQKQKKDKIKKLIYDQEINKKSITKKKVLKKKHQETPLKNVNTNLIFYLIISIAVMCYKLYHHSLSYCRNYHVRKRSKSIQTILLKRKR